jgi:hypothetical protein
MIRKLTKEEQYQLDQRFGPLLSKYFLEMIDTLNTHIRHSDSPSTMTLDESVYSVNPPEEANGGSTPKNKSRNKRLSGAEPGE